MYVYILVGFPWKWDFKKKSAYNVSIQIYWMYGNTHRWDEINCLCHLVQIKMVDIKNLVFNDMVWHSEDSDSRRCAIAQVMQDEVRSSVNHSTVPLFEGV